MTNWFTEYPNNVVDVLSISLLAATVMEHLPQAVSLVSLVWLAIRISETCTIRALASKLRRRSFTRADCILKGGER